MATLIITTTTRRGEHARKLGAKRRAELLAFAERYIREHGYAPSRKTMLETLGMSHVNVYHHLRKLRADGEIIGHADGAHAWTLPKFAAACKAVE